jgi:hypothetical protein
MDDYCATIGVKPTPMPNASQSITNPTWSYRGLNPGTFRGKPVLNPLSYDTPLFWGEQNFSEQFNKYKIKVWGKKNEVLGIKHKRAADSNSTDSGLSV